MNQIVHNQSSSNKDVATHHDRENKRSYVRNPHPKFQTLRCPNTEYRTTATDLKMNTNITLKDD